MRSEGQGAAGDAGTARQVIATGRQGDLAQDADGTVTQQHAGGTAAKQDSSHASGPQNGSARHDATSGRGETDAKQAPRRHRPEDEPLGRPRTARLPKPRAERATQFMPFAALVGFEDYLARAEAEAAASDDARSAALEEPAS